VYVTAVGPGPGAWVVHALDPHRSFELRSPVHRWGSIWGLYGNDVARWDGTAWHLTAITGLPTGTALRSLTAVPGTSTLWAVGQTATSSVAVTNG
jgi:hypothetical protein